ncbi:MAG: diacylglycerol kinase family protein [Nocardioidaceae bacterium]
MPLTDRVRERLLLWAILPALVAAVGVLLGLFHEATLDRIDSWVEVGPEHWRGSASWLEQPLIWVSHAFGTWAMTIYTTIAATVLAVRRQWRAAMFVVVVMTVTGLLNTALKSLVERPRLILEDPVLVFDTSAMPSGHSAGIAAAAGVAAVLSHVFVRKRTLRRVVLVVALALCVLVGLDRLLLGVHTLTDVLAGFGVGATVTLVAAAFFDPSPPMIKAAPLPAGPIPVERKLACILNPIKVESVEDFQATVESAAAAAGYGPPDWYLTTVEDPGRAMAETAAITGASLVLVCGGDGTVRTVCGELAGTGIPVGVVPAGTGNLLARNIDLPLHLRSAVDVALNGQDRAIDIVHVTGDGIGEHEHYLVMAGMGIDAAIMEGANEQLKAKVGWIAYIVSGVRNMMYPAVRLEVSVDDGPFTKHRARTVVIGNVGNLQGGLPLLPDAAIDDGTIDLVMIYPKQFLSWLRVAFRVLSRSARSDETVNRMSGRKIVVRAATDTPRQIDGDAIGAGREVVAEVLPGKLLVRVPR